jgi:Ca-activated chloride channel family protein
MNQMFGGEVKSLVDAVTQTALNYRLLSQYTAFVAVSEEVRVNPDGGKVTVNVPVEMPQGVNFGMTSGEVANSSSLKPAAPNSVPMPSQQYNSRVRLQGGTPFTGSDKLNTRLSPKVDSINSPAEPSKVSQQSVSKVQIVSISGIAGVDISIVQQAIAQQLQSINVPAGFNGTVVLEIPIQNGRLTRFVLDDVVSTVKDKNLVDLIKRSLQNVVLSSTAKGNIRLTLNVTS